MVRQAEIGDFDAVYALLCALEGVVLDRDAVSRIYAEVMENAASRVLVAERDGHVAGMLHLRFEAQLHHAARVAEIMELCVGESCRSQGVGAELVAKAQRIAEEAGASLIEVACNIKRGGAHRFYERQGLARTHYKFTRPLD